jgi:hypothetical protein
MKHLLLSAFILLNPAYVIAQEDEGKSLMEQGAELFLRGLQQQMEPALQDLQGLADEMGPQLHGFLMEMGPALKDLVGQVEDWSAYHPPEVLPNGDIIIRRKTTDNKAETEEGEETTDL